MIFSTNGALAVPVDLKGTGTAEVVGAGTTGDTNPRVQLSADGAVRFGTGAGATDATISRSGVNALSCGGLWQVSGTAGLLLSTAGGGLRIKSGTNAKIGTAALVAGTVTVATTAVTAASLIFLTSQADGGTPGFLRVTAITAGTSFVITSSNAADTSTVAWLIIEPG